MKSKKLLACLMAGAMVISMAACGNSGETPDTDIDVVEEEFSFDDAASITFADGNFGFIGSDASVNPAAKETVFELVDRNERKAVKITSSAADKIYAGIQMDALLGDNLSKVASVDMVIETETGDSFMSTSGKIVSFTGEASDAKKETGWSIYLENKNPKLISAAVPAAVEGNYLVLTLEVNAPSSAMSADVPTALYLYSISFKDADGNVLAVDTTAEYKAVATGEDRSNLFGITNAVEMALVGGGDGWSQIGYVDFTEEEWAALTTPGSVVEIAYKAETGNIWMGLSGNAWKRIGVGDCDGSGQGYAYYNNSRSIAQITYEDIVSVVGDDTSAWDKQIFIESDGAFEVFSIKIGQQAPVCTIVDAIDLGLSGDGAGWAQIGYVDIPDDAFELLKTPGSALEISYSSVTGDIWAGLSGNAWTRVGVGDADGSGTVDAITDGSTCYVTYDMFAAQCGDDTSAWDKQIFIESNDAFEVYSVKVGKVVEIPTARKLIDIGLSGDGAGWAQIGYVDIPEDAFEVLKTPGSVMVISYSSVTGDIWAGLSGNAWTRVGVGNADGSGTVDAATTGSVCYVTYDMFAAQCGDDSSAWDKQIFIESNDAFEVYSVQIGIQ